MWCTKPGCPGSGSVQEKRILDPHFTHFGSFSRPLPLLSGILPHHTVAEVARQATLILSESFGNQPKFERTWRCTLCAQSWEGTSLSGFTLGPSGAKMGPCPN